MIISIYDRITPEVLALHYIPRFRTDLHEARGVPSRPSLSSPGRTLFSGGEKNEAKKKDWSKRKEAHTFRTALKRFFYAALEVQSHAPSSRIIWSSGIPEEASANKVWRSNERKKANS